MTRLTVQSRLFLLIATLVVLFLGGLVILYRTGEQQAGLILQERAKEKAALLEQLVDLFGQPTHTLSYDYSYWDEMVAFVRSRDTAWAVENLDVSLTNYHTSAIWVYDNDWNEVYRVAIDTLRSSSGDEALRESFRTGYARDRFSHFYAWTSAGVLEVRTAPIQPSADDARETPPQGVLVVGKLLDKAYVAALGQALEAGLSIVPSRGIAGKDSGVHSDEREPGVVHINHWFRDTDGLPVAELHGRIETPLYTVLRRTEWHRLLYFAVYALTILLLLAIALRRWIGKPLENIIHAIKSGTAHTASHRDPVGREFGDLREHLATFLEQRRQLVEEIVERTRAEENLRNREQLLHATLESTADGILVVDAFGVVTHWNSRFRDMWRIPKELVERRNDQQMIDYVLSQLRDPQGFLDKVMELYGTADASFDTLEFTDGRVFERYSCPLITQEKVTGRVWSFHDITQRVEAEEVRRELGEKLQRAERMESLGILAGGVAHDLNNMLGPIVGYSELLLRELPPESKTATKVRKITKSAEDAAAVISDLLTLARRGRYELKPLQLTDVINGYLESPSFERLKSRFPRVTFDIVIENEQSMVLGSAPHLSKVFMNLITNACEAIPVEGRVGIRSAQRHVNRLPSGFHNVEPGDYVVVSITDTGVGILPAAIKRIFEPYYSTKQMGHSGSGLGLAVVYGIIKDHHGYYDIMSEPGQGTEFLLYFPVTKETSSSALGDESSLPRGNESILVVDDSPDQRELATELLGTLGYHLATADNGHEAVKYLGKTTADLILLDMIMEPGFDGLDTYRAIQAVRPGQKAIIVSGFSATERVQEMQSLGAGQYIKKPYNLETMARAVRRELDRNRPPTGEPNTFVVDQQA